jgi:tRNA threonylcarbamoyladenosine biosynthesis protein TsaB
MLLLGIDTSTRRVGCVLASEHVQLGRVEIGGAADGRRPRHVESLVPAIRYLCDESGVALDQVSAVAVGVGPGMFTGLRVGVTTAKMLAHALRVPVIPIASLDLLAYPFRHSRVLVVATIDARRGELYHAMYRAVPGGVQRVSEYDVGTPDDLAGDIAALGVETLLCGDGAQRYAATFGALERVELAGAAHVAPSLSALAELAIARYEREDFSPPGEVVPFYVRRTDAEIAWERRGA